MVLHADERTVDADLVSRLLAEQLPHLAHLRPVAVDVQGSVNVVHRLGDGLCTRLPRRREYVQDLQSEVRWLAELSPHLTLAAPEVVALGRPGQGYPFPWAVYRWVEGVPYDDGLVDDEARAARDLARFVEGLRRAGVPAGAPSGGRAPLTTLAATTGAAVQACAPELGQDGVTALSHVWEQALGAPVWDGPGVWVHADLLPFNLTVRAGALHGVLDFGSAGVGDPAADVIAAWTVFGPTGRAALRSALDVDRGTWERARGYALHQAADIVPYYRHSHPAFAAAAVRTLRRVLEPDR